MIGAGTIEAAAGAVRIVGAKAAGGAAGAVSMAGAKAAGAGAGADRVLADGVLDDLNEDARRIILVMADTGMRLTEVVNLTREAINLTAPIPFVSVRADGRRLKTKQSERDTLVVDQRQSGGLK